MTEQNQRSPCPGKVGGMLRALAPAATSSGLPRTGWHAGLKTGSCGHLPLKYRCYLVAESNKN